ncbi:MAG TPA: dihydrolipoamide acetyltransferase family protein [Candidatus Binatia bacterium]|nr:dihydrolipoamide acetyltransferase family protein [Candidatus Binatia bacterium]
MPKLTDTMEEGTIVRWLKRVGDRVTAGEILAEVETDKADMELEAAGAGTVTEIRVAEGETARVGAIVAILSGPGEQNVAKTPARPKAVVEPIASAAESADPVVESPTPQATPLARRVAQQSGVDLRTIAGAGQHGRVQKRDVTAAARSTTAAAVSPPVQSAPPPTGRVELSKMRQTIARRMTEAMRDIPHFYVTNEIDMGEALRLRVALRETGVVTESVSVTHVIIKAVAIALQRQPRVNASWADNALQFNDAVNIGIATAVEDGLLVPVLKGCERLTLGQIASAARALNEKARGGFFAAEEMLGATFTISNLGMRDVDDFTGVINPPQAAILAVGAIKERPVVRDGKLTVGQTMRVTLSCDHRILNGVEGAQFLEELKRLLENPVALVIA